MGLLDTLVSELRGEERNLTLRGFAIVDSQDRLACVDRPHPQTFLVMLWIHGYKAATREVQDEVSSARELMLWWREEEPSRHWPLVDRVPRALEEDLAGDGDFGEIC